MDPLLELVEKVLNVKAGFGVLFRKVAQATVGRISESVESGAEDLISHHSSTLFSRNSGAIGRASSQNSSSWTQLTNWSNRPLCLPLWS